MHMPWKVLTTVLAVAACGKGPSDSSLKFRPADPNAVNVFYLIGAPNGLEGVQTDLREMNKVLRDATNGYNWTVQSNALAKKADILRDVATYAAQVGETGTLGLYFSGHGSKEGEFLTQDELLSFPEVASAIETSRVTPLKRLLTFNDSCYSGNWVDGNGKLPEDKLFPAEYFADPSRLEAQSLAESAADLMAKSFLTKSKMGGKDAVTEFLTFAASKKTQTALDYGAEKGGAFTYVLRTTFKNLKMTKADVTVGEFAYAAAEETYQMTRHHRPIYRAYPESLLSEKLFEFAH